MRVLLLSAYAAASHRHWQRALQAMSPHWQWQLLELPPRHFSWRVRGNPLYWSQVEAQTLRRDYDLLVATSMVDLATLRGLVPELGRIPSLLYFHENQFAYPQGRNRHGLLEAQMVSLYSALAADRIAFNSRWNRDSFLDGLDALLRRLPDRVPSGIVESLRGRSEVLPVPLASVEAPEQAAGWPAANAQTLRLLWVGRFEHDKGPERLLATLRELQRSGVTFQLALAGQQFRDSPAEFEQIREEFAPQLVQFGYLETRAELYALMRGADLVLSTATHEFQGLAVMEAVQRGCVPVLPRRLCYPEIYPQHCLYAGGEPEAEGRAAAAHIETLLPQLQSGALQPPSLSDYSAGALAPRYLELLQGIAAG